MKRILLALYHKETRHLLQSCLEQEYEIVWPCDPPAEPGDAPQEVGDPGDWPEDLGLAIVDRPVLERHAGRLEEHRPGAWLPRFPLLLVASRPELEEVRHYLGSTIDDVILTPIEPIELEARVQALLPGRQRAAEAPYRLLFERSQAGVYFSTVDGRFLDCNPAFARMLGYDTPRELLGRPALDIYFEPADRDAFLAQLELEEGVTNLEWRLRRRDGQPLWVLENASLIRDEEGRPAMIQGTLIDVTEQKLAKEAIRRSAVQREALRQVDLALAADLDLDDLLRSIVSHAIRLVDASCGGVYFYQPEGEVLACGVTVGDWPLSVGATLHRGEGLAGEVWASGKPRYAGDQRGEEEGAGAPGEAGLAARMAVPVRWGDDFLGVLAVGAQPAHRPPFAPSEVELLSLFATQAAIAVHNARLLEAEQAARAGAEAHVADLAARERYLAVLNDIAQTTLRMPDLSSTLDVLADQLGALIGADGCYITLWDPEMERPIPAAAYGPFHHSYRKFRPASGEITMTESVLRERRPLVVEDVFDTPYLSHHIAALFPTRSLMALPLVSGEKKVGAVLLSFEEPHHFTEDEVSLCQKITGQVVLLLTKARWYEEIQQQVKEMTLLSEISAALSTTLDVDAALQIIARRLTAFMDVAGCAISSWDRDGDALVLLLDYSFDSEWWEPDAAGTVYPLDRYPTTRQVLAERRPRSVHVADPDAHPTELSWMIRQGIMSLLMVPLVIGDRVIGLLEVMEARHERVFHPREVRLCQMLANQAASALDMRRLYKEARRRNRDLALLNRVISASSAGQEIEGLLETVCQELAMAFGVPRATAALRDGDGTTVSLVAEYRDEDQPSRVGWSFPPSGLQAFQHLMQQGVPLVIDDVRIDPRVAAAARQESWRDVVSMLIVPLVMGGEPVGALAMVSTEPHLFTAGDVELARRVAEQVSGALARIRLAETQQRLSTAVEQAAEIVIIVANHGIMIYANPAFEQITGYSQAEMVGREIGFLAGNKEEVPAHRALLAALSAGEGWEGLLPLQRKDGTWRTVETTISPVRSPAGEVVNYIATMRDVTREMELDEQVRQAQKMDAVGRLAGGIAHDFNNLLTVIHLSSRLIERSLRPDDPLWDHVQRIRETGERAGRLTKQLLSFSRREIVKPEVLILNDLLANLNRMLERVISEDIELRTILAGDLWPIKIDPSQVEQVVLNLVVNARDAMPTGGALIVETANVVLDEAYATHHLEVQPGEYVMLAVSDTGVGMDEEIKSHIFEPFFTTKERGKGTGLGLATVFGIVKQNGGHIAVDSEVGEGSLFKIYLPRVMEEARELSRAGSGMEQSMRGTETILLVEDESEVQQLVTAILRAQGYHVLAARDGVEALQIAAMYEEPIHLLLTDVVMPGISGKQLADRLLAGRPAMRVLYASGYTDDAIATRGVLTNGTQFLPKPFDVDTLTRKVRDVLDARA